MSETTQLAESQADMTVKEKVPTRWTTGDFSHYEPPKVNYEPCRWTTARTRNVEDIASSWEEDDALAYVFNDKKLRGNELVMLRKKLLNEIMTPLHELYRGRAAIRIDIDMIVANVEALSHSLKSLMSCLDPGVETTTQAARAALANVKLLEVQIGRISASVVVSNPKSTPIAEMTDEDEALAAELIAEEEADNED